MSINYLSPTPDWLSISFSSMFSPFMELDSFLSQLGISSHTDSHKKSLYKFIDGGSCYCLLEADYHNFSFSGSLLGKIRELNLLNEFVSVLLEHPSNITRLDIAFDMPVAFTTYYAKLKALYPTGTVQVLGHSRNSQVILSNCPRTNDLTGTYYFQTSSYKGNTKIKVYDKSFEVYQRTGNIIPSTTRIEITLSRSVSLKDFVKPSSAFWHHLPSDLVERPSGVPEFVKKPRITLISPSESSLTVFQKYELAIERSAYLTALKTSMVGQPLASKRALRLSLLNFLDLHDN